MHYSFDVELIKQHATFDRNGIGTDRTTQCVLIFNQNRRCSIR